MLTIWQHFDIVAIIVLSIGAYFYCRIKIEDFFDYANSIIIFGVILLFITGLLVLISYGQVVLRETILLKKDFFLERFFLIGSLLSG